MGSIAVITVTICIISLAWAQLPFPYFERPSMITTNTRCIGILIPFSFFFSSTSSANTIVYKNLINKKYKGKTGIPLGGNIGI